MIKQELPYAMGNSKRHSDMDAFGINSEKNEETIIPKISKLNLIIDD